MMNRDICFKARDLLKKKYRSEELKDLNKILTKKKKKGSMLLLLQMNTDQVLGINDSNQFV
jgi:hypothetical protein